MNENDVIRAWKDADYRSSLSDEERARLPEHPAGLIELSDADMGAVVGAGTPLICTADSTYAYQCCEVQIVAPTSPPARVPDRRVPSPGISVPLPPPSIVGS